MDTITYLRLHFTTAVDDEWSLTVRYPKADLTAAQVQTCMNAIINSGAFATAPIGIAGADIYQRTVTEFDFS